ncbi:cryptochrome/photolyase family protein [Mucilaginibacter sp. RS28]|uniref:Cryptochrome/photolyase family protein n=1 Tax=Mucilaginibacter straminoryzae TaxID=2932774 RepID=A0A9X1X662_9SPHI|nr:cryptochrome/photolyase family protein [Mucilaginibacter straminoryzae]MCJ8210373.1 cryptochrome/photolyase family protein [Mucilaginibacter straminoryzae]
MMAKTLRLILGDQLNLQHRWFARADKDVYYTLLEVKQEQEYVHQHVQKIMAFFAAMRNFAHQLEKAGHQVIYIKLDDDHNTHDFEKNIKRLIKEYHFERFEYQLPDEYRLDEQLRNLCLDLKIEAAAADTEHFYTSRDDLKNFFGDRKSYLMESFYRNMRVKYGIMMNDKDPIGDRWNFDAENRKKYDGKVPLPRPLVHKHNLSELKQMIDQMGVSYFGRVGEKHFEWPLSRKEALESLRYFCKNLLPHFGTYEDAMLQNHASLFHSRLSFALNTKMISPREVVSAVLAAWDQDREHISIAQVEGYVRQVIGWREFMRGVYWAQMPGYAELNYFNHKTKLPGWYWTGETKMNCLNKCINQSLDLAWAHHIQRLMVIGNFSMLMGAHPDEVDAWYLGVYIDAIQWVEITNTRGMSQFADGGIVGSKPYASSAAYINRMSDYCKHCHYDYKKKYGEGACPFNSLYWNFLDAHRDKFGKNPRMGMVYKNLNNMNPEELQRILEQAEDYLGRLEEL